MGFFRQTPGQYSREMRAASKRILSRRREQIILAHSIGSLVGFAKPPPLDKLLKALEPKKPQPPMSETEIMATMDLWRSALSARPPIEGRT